MRLPALAPGDELGGDRDRAAGVEGPRILRRALLVQHGGRRALPACDGQGAIVAEMSFLPEVVTPCEACQGARFEPSTLEVKWAGYSIGDVLRLSAEKAAGVFAAHPKIARPLAILTELGVGYVSPLGTDSYEPFGPRSTSSRLQLWLVLAACGTSDMSDANANYLRDCPVPARAASVQGDRRLFRTGQGG